MQAVILAAGRGQRLAPVTNHLPKCLVPIDGKPLLQYQMEALKKWGVQKLCVVVGSHKEKIQDFLKSEPGIQVVENPEYQTTNIIASFWCALSVIKPADDLVVMAGDVLFEESVIKNLLESPEADMTLCVERKRCGEEEVKVILKGNLVTGLGKNLDPKNCYGEFLGVFKARRVVFEEIRQIVNEMVSARQVQGYLFDMINRLAQERKRVVRGLEIGDALWEDIDVWEDVERVTRKFRSKRKALLTGECL